VCACNRVIFLASIQAHVYVLYLYVYVYVTNADNPYSGLKINLLARSTNPPKNNKQALKTHYVQLVDQHVENVIEGAKENFKKEIVKIVMDSLKQVFSYLPPQV